MFSKLALQDILPLVNKAGSKIMYASSVNLQIKYIQEGKQDQFAVDGNILTPRDVAKAPNVTWEPNKIDPSSYYSLIMTDPDAPSRSEPIYREFIHWVVVNIPGSITSNGDITSSGETIIPYVGSGPPCNSGLHRYVFLLYDQAMSCEGTRKPNNGRLTQEDINKSRQYFEQRGGLSANHWATNLMNVNFPIAMNAYQAEWDESVDELHKVIGFMPPLKYRSPSQLKENPN